MSITYRLVDSQQFVSFFNKHIVVHGTAGAYQFSISTQVEENMLHRTNLLSQPPSYQRTHGILSHQILT
jgi:hypothetical protein